MNTLLSPEMRMARGDPQESIEEEAAIKRHLFQQATRVIVSSEAERMRITRAFPELDTKLASSPYLRPGLSAAPHSCLERHLDTGVVQILFVGNDAHRKGLPETLAAIAGLSRTIREMLQLTVVSGFTDGPVDIPTDIDCRVLGSTSHLEVLKLFRSSHVLANPAKFESYGFVFLEAMANGAVPIAPNWEVQREILDEGLAGWLVAPEVESIRDTLQKVVEQPDDRMAKAIHGLERFRSKYSESVVAQRLQSLLTVNSA